MESVSLETFYEDILKVIISYLSLKEIFRLTGVSKKLKGKLETIFKQWSILDLSPFTCTIQTDALGYILQYCPNLKQLSLQECCRITDSDLMHISSCPYLEKLNLQGCTKITTRGLQAASESASKLKTLDLRGATFDIGHFGDPLVQSISSSCHELEELYLWNSTITDSGIEHLCKNCPNLKLADLWMSQHITNQSIDHFITYALPLEHLNFSHCPGISSDGIKKLAHHFPKLRTLQLTSAGKESNVGEGLIEVAKEGIFEQLETLSVRKIFDLEESTVCELVTRFKNLRELNLGGCEIGDETLFHIADNCPNMKNLFLWSTNITIRGLQKLAEKCFFLEQLELWNCRDVTDEGVGYLANGKCSQTLKELILRGCVHITDVSMEHLAKSCKNLEILSLRACALLTDQGIETLCNGCTNILELNLSFCHQLGDASLIAIGKNLKKLSKVLISELDITDQGVKGLMQNSRLAELQLKNCPEITDLSLKYISSCTSIKRLDLENNPNITDIGVDFLRNLNKLEELYLGMCDITASSIMQLLMGCRGMQELKLSECPRISDSDIMEIEDLYPDIEIDF